MSWRAKFREQAKGKLCTRCKEYVDKTVKKCPHCNENFFLLSEDNDCIISTFGNVYCGCTKHGPTLRELPRDGEEIKDEKCNRIYTYHKCAACGSIYSFELVIEYNKE